MAKVEVLHPEQKYTISDKRQTFVIGRKLDITYFVTKTKPLGTPIMIFSPFRHFRHFAISPFYLGVTAGVRVGAGRAKMEKMDKRKNIYMDYHMGVTSKQIILTSCTIRVMVPMM